MVTVSSRVHRILSPMKSFHRAGDERLANFGGLLHAIDQEALGVYLNSHASLDDAILVTNDGLFLNKGGQWESIPFDSILCVETPATTTDVGQLRLNLASGSSVTLPVRGGDGRFSDAFEFLRFLDRVLADRRGS